MGTLTRQAIFMWRVSFETTLPMTFNIYVYPSKKWRSLFIFTLQKISKPLITPIEKYQWRSCTKMSQLWVTWPRQTTLEVIQKRDSAEITLKRDSAEITCLCISILFWDRSKLGAQLTLGEPLIIHRETQAWSW